MTLQSLLNQLHLDVLSCVIQSSIFAFVCSSDSFPAKLRARLKRGGTHHFILIQQAARSAGCRRGANLGVPKRDVTLRAEVDVIARL